MLLRIFSKSGNFCNTAAIFSYTTAFFYNFQTTKKNFHKIKTIILIKNQVLFFILNKYFKNKTETMLRTAVKTYVWKHLSAHGFRKQGLDFSRFSSNKTLPKQPATGFRGNDFWDLSHSFKMTDRRAARAHFTPFNWIEVEKIAPQNQVKTGWIYYWKCCRESGSQACVCFNWIWRPITINRKYFYYYSKN